MGNSLNGLKFSKTVTQFVHFCRLRRFHNDPEFFISGSKIPVVDETQFVTFDKKSVFLFLHKIIKSKIP